MTISNKKAISELKKFNADLEKHIGEVDIDLMTEKLKSSSTKSSSDKEFNTLFAENLLDVRTELMILRKNMAVDIEGMVMRVVNNQQNQFVEKMNDMFLRTVVEMKQSLNESLSHFATEISELKRTNSEIILQNNNLVNNVKNISTGLSLLKSTVEDVKVSANNSRFDLKLSELTSLVNSSTKYILQNEQLLSSNNDKLSRNLFEISKKLDITSKQFSQTDTRLVKGLSKINENIGSAILSNTKIKNEFKEREPVEIVVEKSEPIILDEISVEPVVEKIPSKILNIDERLGKLSSLK